MSKPHQNDRGGKRFTTGSNNPTGGSGSSNSTSGGGYQSNNNGGGGNSNNTSSGSGNSFTTYKNSNSFRTNNNNNNTSGGANSNSSNSNGGQNWQGNQNQYDRRNNNGIEGDDRTGFTRTRKDINNTINGASGIPGTSSSTSSQSMSMDRPRKKGLGRFKFESIYQEMSRNRKSETAGAQQASTQNTPSNGSSSMNMEWLNTLSTQFPSIFMRQHLTPIFVDETFCNNFRVSDAFESSSSSTSSASTSSSLSSTNHNLNQDRDRNSHSSQNPSGGYSASGIPRNVGGHHHHAISSSNNNRPRDNGIGSQMSRNHAIAEDSGDSSDDPEWEVGGVDNFSFEFKTFDKEKHAAQIEAATVAAALEREKVASQRPRFIGNANNNQQIPKAATTKQQQQPTKTNEVASTLLPAATVDITASIFSGFGIGGDGSESVVENSSESAGLSVMEFFQMMGGPAATVAPAPASEIEDYDYEDIDARLENLMKQQQKEEPRMEPKQLETLNGLEVAEGKHRQLTQLQSQQPITTMPTQIQLTTLVQNEFVDAEEDEEDEEDEDNDDTFGSAAAPTALIQATVEPQTKEVVDSSKQSTQQQPSTAYSQFASAPLINSEHQQERSEAFNQGGNRNNLFSSFGFNDAATATTNNSSSMFAFGRQDLQTSSLPLIQQQTPMQPQMQYSYNQKSYNDQRTDQHWQGGAQMYGGFASQTQVFQQQQQQQQHSAFASFNNQLPLQIQQQQQQQQYLHLQQQQHQHQQQQTGFMPQSYSGYGTSHLPQPSQQHQQLQQQPFASLTPSGGFYMGQQYMKGQEESAYNDEYYSDANNESNEEEQDRAEVREPVEEKDELEELITTKVDEKSQQEEMLDMFLQTSELERREQEEKKREKERKNLDKIGEIMAYKEEENENYFQAAAYLLQENPKEEIWVYKDSYGSQQGPFDSVKMDAWKEHFVSTEVSYHKIYYWISYKELTLYTKLYANRIRGLLKEQRDQQLMQQNSQLLAMNVDETNQVNPQVLMQMQQLQRQMLNQKASEKQQQQQVYQQLQQQQMYQQQQHHQHHQHQQPNQQYNNQQRRVNNVSSGSVNSNVQKVAATTQSHQNNSVYQQNSHQKYPNEYTQSNSRSNQAGHQNTYPKQSQTQQQQQAQPQQQQQFHNQQIQLQQQQQINQQANKRARQQTNEVETSQQHAAQQSQVKQNQATTIAQPTHHRSTTDERSQQSRSSAVTSTTNPQVNSAATSKSTTQQASTSYTRLNPSNSSSASGYSTKQQPQQHAQTQPSKSNNAAVELTGHSQTRGKNNQVVINDFDFPSLS